MLKDFVSRGRPRTGQWVWVAVGDERFLAIVDGPDHGLFRTRTSRLLRDEIEVVGFPSREEVLANRAAPPDVKKHGRPGFYAVSVLEIGKRETAFHVLVDGDRLTPVVSRDELPAAVTSTMRPDFVPQP